jgi:hypothetical protein
MERTVERLYLYPEGECWVAQFAIDGRVCVPFYIHKSTAEKFHTETEFMDFLAWKAEQMLATYGPGRAGYYH